MKKANIWHQLRTILMVATRFSCYHVSVQKALAYSYKTIDDKGSGFYSFLEFTPLGSLYEVVVTDYLGPMALDRQRWLAFYAWGSSGILVEIGGERFCIFNPEQKTVHIEELLDSGETKTTLFTQKLEP
jgi:hypothetical protein